MPVLHSGFSSDEAVCCNTVVMFLLTRIYGNLLKVFTRRLRCVVAQLVEALCYRPVGHGFWFLLGSLGFFIDLILLATLWTWG